MQLGLKNSAQRPQPLPVLIVQHLRCFAAMSAISQAYTRIGDTIPDFSCESTFGALHFHEVCDRMMSVAEELVVAFSLSYTA